MTELATRILNRLRQHKTEYMDGETKKAKREKREPEFASLLLWSLDNLSSVLRGDDKELFNSCFYVAGLREAVQELVDSGEVKWHEEFGSCFYLTS